MMMGQIILLYGICYITMFIVDRMLLADPTNINYVRYHHVVSATIRHALAVVYLRSRFLLKSLN